MCLTAPADCAQVGDEADSGVVNHRFVQQALSPLVPALLAQLTKQEEGQDKDDGLWNLSMAAGTCLGLVATVVGDHIIILVMPYVQVDPCLSIACTCAMLQAIMSADLSVRNRCRLKRLLCCSLGLLLLCISVSVPDLAAQLLGSAKCAWVNIPSSWLYMYTAARMI